MPVVPAVYSTTVPPGRRRPSASAASIAARAMRSFMLPVGFAASSLISSRAAPGGTMRRSSTSGVLPMPSKADMARQFSAYHRRVRAALAIVMALALPRAASLERAQKLLWEHRYADAASIYRDRSEEHT